jgi:hypothetical protein
MHSGSVKGPVLATAAPSPDPPDSPGLAPPDGWPPPQAATARVSERRTGALRSRTRSA